MIIRQTTVEQRNCTVHIRKVKFYTELQQNEEVIAIKKTWWQPVFMISMFFSPLFSLIDGIIC